MRELAEVAVEGDDLGLRASASFLSASLRRRAASAPICFASAEVPAAFSPWRRLRVGRLRSSAASASSWRVAAATRTASHSSRSGLDDGGADEALDVGARGVFGAEFVAFAGIERAGEQGAEDGRLDGAPIGGGGIGEHGELRGGEREGGGVFKQPAIEAGDFLEQQARRSGCRWPFPSTARRRAPGSRAGVSLTRSSRVLKPSSGSRPTSSANMVKRQRWRNPAMTCGSWPSASRDLASTARRPAMSRVTSAACLEGSSEWGSSPDACGGGRGFPGGGDPAG